MPRRLTPLLGAGLLIATATVALASAQAPPTTPSAAPAAASTPAPAASPVVPASPGASATPTYRFVYRPTPPPAGTTTPFPLPNAPQIAEIDLSDATLVTPGTIRVRVVTSDAVASVVAETFGNSFAIPKKESGLFTFEGYVGDVPSFVKNRTYDVTFTATGVDGRNAAVTLPLTLR